MLFEDYVKHGDKSPYSRDNLMSLTLSAAATCTLPPELAPGTISSHVFTREEALHDENILVGPDEQVPSAEDLLPITRAMQQAYADGMRSVVVNFSRDDRGVQYHLAKVCTMMLRAFGS